MRYRRSDEDRVHPFVVRYDTIERVDWETCSTLLDNQSHLEELMRSW